LGSLATAVASFLHARQARGEWLVWVEDIDPPREVTGAADDILRTLEAFELEWDRSVLYQSRRLEAYDAVARRLLGDGRGWCRCSRSEIRAANEGESGRYPGTCRERHLEPGDAAVRARRSGSRDLRGRLAGQDRDRSSRHSATTSSCGATACPPTIWAVVLDDAEQGVTTIVRRRRPARLDGRARPLTGRARSADAAVLPPSRRGRRARQKLSKQTGASAVDAS
jgi:glutamyl-Q tRNA(Asp) synthetase